MKFHVDTIGRNVISDLKEFSTNCLIIDSNKGPDFGRQYTSLGSQTRCPN